MKTSKNFSQFIKKLEEKILHDSHETVLLSKKAEQRSGAGLIVINGDQCVNGSSACQGSINGKRCSNSDCDNSSNSKKCTTIQPAGIFNI